MKKSEKIIKKKKEKKNSAFHPGNLRVESKLTLLPARLLVRVSSGFREILFRRFIFISNRNAICFKPIYIYLYIYIASFSTRGVDMRSFLGVLRIFFLSVSLFSFSSPRFNAESC